MMGDDKGPAGINNRAITLPVEKLVGEIKKGNEEKRQVLRERDRKYGADRPKIGSYMENIALPGLFGFDMNDFYKDPELCMEVELRHKLYWLDNSHDDKLAGFGVNAGTMYFDMTLFGLNINYNYDGVPYFEPHPLEGGMDLSLLEPFDFYKTGEMPMVHSRYQRMTEISRERFGGEFEVLFPPFQRGPLDIAVQLRGYENFVSDCAADPDSVHALLAYIVAERLRYNQLYADFCGKGKPGDPMIADDWVNIPFISPGMFNEFVVPAYKKIQDNEGIVADWHTCGIFLPILESLLDVLHGMKNLDLGGYNIPDCLEIHRIARKDMKFCISFINAFTILGKPEEHREAFEKFGRMIRDGREVVLTAAAIEPILGAIGESVAAMNRFIDSAREYFAAL